MGFGSVKITRVEVQGALIQAENGDGKKLAEMDAAIAGNTSKREEFYAQLRLYANDIVEKKGSEKEAAEIRSSLIKYRRRFCAICAFAASWRRYGGIGNALRQYGRRRQTHSCECTQMDGIGSLRASNRWTRKISTSYRDVILMLSSQWKEKAQKQ